MRTNSGSGSGTAFKGKRAGSLRRRRYLAQMAVKHIRERGFEGLSVNTLADDVGISVGGMYRYIKTKSDLLVMACEDIYGDLRERIVEVALGEQRIPCKLRDAMRVYFSSCNEMRDIILLMYREYRNLPADAQKHYRDREESIVGVFSDLITSGIRQGVFARVNAHVLARDIVFLGHMPALKGWSLRAHANQEQVLDEHVNLILGQLTPVTSEGPRLAR